MVATAQSLVRELGMRLGDYWALNPTAVGTTTALIDSQLPTVMPQTQGSGTAPLGAWVYGSPTADAPNVGVSRRAVSYNSLTTTLNFLTAWPSAPTTGTYEMHKRFARDRKLEALNSGVRQLGLYWTLRVQMNPITILQDTWRYALPNWFNWQSIDRIQLQIDTDAGLTGYPYTNAEDWNASLEQNTNIATGVTEFFLQFGALPPVGNLVRIWAEGQLPDLVSDTDILALQSTEAGRALEWLYSWSACQLYRWESLSQPQNQTEWLEKQVGQLLKEAEDLRTRLAHVRGTTRLVLPGRGTGEADANWAYRIGYLDYYG